MRRSISEQRYSSYKQIDDAIDCFLKKGLQVHNITEFKKYLGLKSIVKYKRIFEIIDDSQECGTISDLDIGQVNIYDERIREQSFKYIKMFELYVKSQLSNIDLYKNYKKLSSLQMRPLFTHIKSFDLDQINTIFSTNLTLEEYSNSFEDITRYRNAVSHHDFLFENKKKIKYGWLAFLFVIIHFVFILISIFPKSFTTPNLHFISNQYVQPFFVQRWAMFAPCPTFENRIKLKFYFQKD